MPDSHDIPIVAIELGSAPYNACPSVCNYNSKYIGLYLIVTISDKDSELKYLLIALCIGLA